MTPLMNVLLVESSPEDLTLLEKALENEGYQLLRARSAEETRRIVEAGEPHILLLSAQLPESDAFEMVRKCRATRRDTPLQVILLSSVRQQQDIHKAVEAGADDFIKKPFDVHELQARTKAAVLRWKNQANLVKEREFYRIAVAEEERLSSLVLDQNRDLKDAYEKIRKLNEELEKLAAYDSLSGLLNRRSLFHRISVEIDRSTRLDQPLTGLMIDIDHFKEINDNYGHPCGDMVIREIGARLLSGLRKYDYAGRYGGEEFFIVLSNSTDQQAIGIGERFRRDMEEKQLTCNGESFLVTVSIGVARYHPGESQESWIERADRAMYQAKQGGRNRIVSD